MHLIFLNQYYPPDAAPTGVMLRGLVAHLISKGHEVTVICSEGGYTTNDSPNKITKSHTQDPGSASILRIKTKKLGRGTFLGKLSDYLCYYFGVIWLLLFVIKKPARIVALTTPPYLSLVARFASKMNGGDHAHWVMDLYPDVMVSHGIITVNGLLHRFLAKLTAWGFGGKRCASVHTIGPDIAEKITKKYLLPSVYSASWTPLWSPTENNHKVSEEEICAWRQKMGWGEKELIIMYSGNMGLGHLFDEILQVAAKEIQFPSVYPEKSYRFVFFGKGKRRKEIEEFQKANPNLPIELQDYVHSDSLAVHLKSADIHLVSLSNKWSGTMVPSKLQGVFASARPTIFIGDSNSSIGHWMKESQGGWIVNPGDIEQLALVLVEAICEKIRMQKGNCAERYAQIHFSSQKNICQTGDFLMKRRSYLA